MKLIIASDIHGSATSAKAVLSKAKDKDKVVLLGDIYNHGPRNPLPDGWEPMGVCKTLNTYYSQHSRNFFCIKGNCDSEVDDMISDFKIQKKMTLKDNGRTLFFSHGHKFNYDNPPQGLEKGSVVFYGHFHLPFIMEKDGIYFVNPGSCSLPFQGNPKSYAVYEDGKVSILTLADDTVIFETNLK